MFTYSHARSTYTPSKETGFCFLPFFRPKTRRRSRVKAVQFLPYGSDADTMGAHSSRDSSPTSPRSERASVRLVWVLNVYILADYVYCPFTFIFFTDSDFIIVKHCSSLAKLTRSQVDEKGPDCINEAFIGLKMSKSSHSTTDTGTKEKSLDYCTTYYTIRE